VPHVVDKKYQGNNMGLFIFFLMIGAFVYWVYSHNSLSIDKEVEKEMAYETFHLICEMVKSGKSEEAMETAQIYSSMEGNVAHFWGRLGTILHMEGFYGESIYCFDRSIPLDPCYISFYGRATAHKHLSNYLDALNDIDQCISLMTPNREHERVGLYFSRGELLHVLDRLEESLDCFDKVKQIDCTYKTYERLMAEGLSLLYLGIYEESIIKFNEVLKLSGRQALAYYYKGINFKYMGRYEEAIEMYDKALEEEPNLDNAFKARQALIEELSYSSNSEKANSEKANIHPLLWTGHRQIQNQMYDEGIKLFRNVLDVENDNLEAWYGCAICSYHLQNYEEALSYLCKAIEYHPGIEHTLAKWDFKLLRAKIYLKLLQYQDALSEIECSINNLGVDGQELLAELYFYGGSALDKLNRFEEAIEYFNKLEQIDCYFEGINRLMIHGGCLIGLHHYEEAIVKFQEALNLGVNPEDRSTLLALKGLTFEKLENYDEAIKCYEAALRYNSDNDNALNLKQALTKQLANRIEYSNAPKT
jgi:tetratricopeptide (TPR) repeat protein